MRAEIFEDVNEKVLKVVANRSNIRFVMPDDEVPSRTETFEFSRKEFNRFKEYLETEANRIWKNLNPRVADSFESDYDEYYDREYDNEGSLKFLDREGPTIQLSLWPPYGSTNRLYQFNKRKMESFLFDLNYQSSSDNYHVGKE